MKYKDKSFVKYIGVSHFEILAPQPFIIWLQIYPGELRDFVFKK